MSFGPASAKAAKTNRPQRTQSAESAMADDHCQQSRGSFAAFASFAVDSSGLAAFLSPNMGLFTKKSFDELQAEAERGLLRRSLGPWNLTALGIGSIIGTGIFVLTGTVASQNAGPALVFSMIISAVGCAFAGLCYAEFAAMVPVAGSAYTYAYATAGEIFAWIIGWDLILEYALSTATVAVGWSGYFVSLMHDIG